MSRRGCISVGLGLLLLAVSVRPASADLFEKGGASGLGARSMALAGACVALAEEETAVWWNPAGLGGIDTVWISSSVGSIYSGRQQMVNLAAALPMPADAALGVQWTHTYYSPAAVLNTDLFGLAGSLPLTADRRVYLGAGLKLVLGNLPSLSRTFSGMGLDVGIKAQFPLGGEGRMLELGARVQDLDTSLEWSDGLREPVSSSWAVGAAWHLDRRTLLALDIDRVGISGSDAETWLLRLGGEHRFRDLVALRAGFLADNRSTVTVSAGAGVQLAGWEVEYALLGQVAELGLSHRLTVRYGLPTAAPVVKPIPTPERPAEDVTPPPDVEVSIRTDLPVFSPNGDGVADIARFEPDLPVDLPATRDWRWSVVDAQGVTQFSARGRGLPEPAAWNGSAPNGEACPDGVYAVRLEMLNERGQRVVHGEASLQLRTRLPVVSLRVSPDAVPVIQGIAQQPVGIEIGGLDQVDHYSWDLSILDAQGRTVRSFTGLDPVPRVLTWNGLPTRDRTLEAGPYAAVFTVVDTGGLNATVQQAFSLAEVEPKLGLEVDPQVIRPGEKTDGTAVFRLEAEPREWVTAWTLTIHNVLTKTDVRVERRKGTPPKRWSWNGRDDQGRLVPGGSYLLAVWEAEFRRGVTVKSRPIPLATDLGIEVETRALALHLTAVSFEAGSSAIPVGAMKNLLQAAATIRRYAKKYEVQVKGYTDSREAPGEELSLSWERALKVKEYLNTTGDIPAEKISLVGYGARLPLASETTAAGRARNRRVEVVLILQK